MKSNNCFLYFLITALLLSFSNLSLAQSKDKKSLQNEKNKIEKDISNTSKLIQETQKSTKKTTQEIKLIESQMRNYEKLIHNNSLNMLLLEKEIESKKNSIQKMQKEVELLKAQYAKMVYFLYLTRKPANRLVYLFSSKSFNQAWQRMNYFKEYSVIRKTQVQRITEIQEKTAQSIKEIEKIRDEKIKIGAEQEKHKRQLLVKKEEKDNAVKKLKSKESELRASLKSKQRQVASINDKIKKIIEAEIKASQKKNIPKTDKVTKPKATSSDAYQMTNEEKSISDNFAENKGRIIWPVAQGSITERFGEHPHPVLRDVKIRNNGIDIASPNGSSARAVFNGSVSAVVSAPNGTSIVMLRHGEYLSVYSNLSSVNVKKGYSVEMKQNIGSIATDEEGFTVLHFEIWKEKTPQNPEAWISK